MSPELDEELQRLKRRAYDTEASAKMSLRAECGAFQLREEREDGATVRVDDITDEYLALVAFKDDGGSGDSAAYMQIDFDEARELASALEAAADLHEEVEN